MLKEMLKIDSAGTGSPPPQEAAGGQQQNRRRSNKKLGTKPSPHHKQMFCEHIYRPRFVFVFVAIMNRQTI